MVRRPRCFGSACEGSDVAVGSGVSTADSPRSSETRFPRSRFRHPVKESDSHGSQVSSASSSSTRSTHIVREIRDPFLRGSVARARRGRLLVYIQPAVGSCTTRPEPHHCRRDREGRGAERVRGGPEASSDNASSPAAGDDERPGARRCRHLRRQHSLWPGRPPAPDPCVIDRHRSVLQRVGVAAQVGIGTSRRRHRGHHQEVDTIGD